jgi:hypothetical protein
MTTANTEIEITFNNVRIRDFRTYWDAVARGEFGPDSCAGIGTIVLLGGLANLGVL